MTIASPSSQWYPQPPKQITVSGANPTTLYAVLTYDTGTEGSVRMPAAAGAGNIAGVAMGAALPGEKVYVVRPPAIVPVIANAAIVEGAPLDISGVDGRVRTAAPAAGVNAFLLGFSIDDAGAAAEQMLALLLPSIMQG